MIPSLLLLAAAYDLTTMTIPNWISGILAVSFFTLALGFGLSLVDLALSVAIASVVLLFGLIMFKFGWIGGGDAKLMTATALWMGWSQTPAFLLGMCLAGGALTLILLAVRNIPLPGSVAKIAWVGRLHDADEGVPYGIAISLAGVFLISQTTLVQMIAS
jgi:prepilin peptidase CpaA